MPDPTPPSDETLAEALRLYRDERLTQKEIARRMGVSQPTVSGYVRKAREAEAYVEMHDRAEERGWTADSYREIEQHAIDLLGKAEGVAESALVLKVWLALHKDRRALMGLDAPTRLAISKETEGRGASPDRGLMAAVRRLRDRDAQDTKDLNAGRPGVIERRQ